MTKKWTLWWGSRFKKENGGQRKLMLTTCSHFPHQATSFNIHHTHIITIHNTRPHINTPLIYTDLHAQIRTCFVSVSEHAIILLLFYQLPALNLSRFRFQVQYCPQSISLSPLHNNGMACLTAVGFTIMHTSEEKSDPILWHSLHLPHNP